MPAPSPWPSPLIALLLAPILEETVFRAGLHEALIRHRRAHTALERTQFGPSRANLVTALAFASAHLALQPGALAALTVLPALAMGHLYERTRRLWPCVALHAACNAVWLAGTSAARVS